MGGAGSSAVRGAQAIPLNPAGMTEGSVREISLSFSPTWDGFSGPNVPSNRDGGKAAAQDGQYSLSLPFSLLINKRMNRRLSFGLGFYSAGGIKAKFEGIDFTRLNPAAPNFELDDQTIQFDLGITETSIALGYYLWEGLSIGAAWRVARATGEMRLTQVYLAGPNLQEYYLMDLTSDYAHAFRLGLKYTTQDKTAGAGVVYRSAADLNLKGKAQGTHDPIVLDNDRESLTGQHVNVSTTFPNQFAVGFFWKPDKREMLVQETVFTQYSVNRELDFRGPALPRTGDANELPTVSQSWRNQWAIKFGHEYVDDEDMTWRYGYSYTTNTVPENHARAIFPPPGATHTLTMGTGLTMPGINSVLDMAAQYSVASEKGSTPHSQQVRNMSGNFAAKTFTLHASLKFHF